MRLLFRVAAVSGLLVFGALPLRSVGAADSHPILGKVPVNGAAGGPGNGAEYRFLGSGNLTYHGGTVQTGATSDKTYAIYWGTSFSSSYQSLINGFFTNVGRASGVTSNVYYSDTQYYQTVNGVKTYIKYNQAFGASWQDPALPTASSCSSTAGGSLCVSDAAVMNEVSKAINTNHWPTGMGSEFFVFLANGVSTCADAYDCAFTQFCAYHSSYTLNGSTVLYANMPYTGHNLSACGSGNYPNNDSAADSTINVTSHEANETITDGLGTAWYDAAGYEDGDKCAWTFGAQLGGTYGHYYNQSIFGAHYELQEEWSNAHTKCVLQAT